MADGRRAAWLIKVAALTLLLTAMFWELRLCTPAAARWKPEYAAASAEVRSWYETRKLTPEAQKRFWFKSCCDNSDRVEAKFAVSKLGGKDQWFYQRPGEDWREVPPDVIHWDEHAPDGKAVLFAWQGEPTCFFPPEGGL